MQDIYIARAEGELALEEELYWSPPPHPPPPFLPAPAADMVTKQPLLRPGPAWYSSLACLGNNAPPPPPFLPSSQEPLQLERCSSGHSRYMS